MNDTISSLEAEDELSLSSSDAEVNEFAIANMVELVENCSFDSALNHCRVLKIIQLLKENVTGHRIIIKVEFETAGKAYDNALASDIGPTETEKIQSMIGKYLENQGALAKAVSFTSLLICVS